MEKEKHLYKKQKARGLLGTNQLNLTMEKIPFVSKGGQELQWRATCFSNWMKRGT